MDRNREIPAVKIGSSQIPFVDISPSVKMGKDCVIRNFVFIGDNSILGDRVRISNYCNIDRNCRIGNDCNLQVGVFLAANTIVGYNCFFAAHTLFADEKYPAVGPQVGKACTIGNNVVTGMGAKIAGGLAIGDNAVLGMGAIVIKDVPPNQVWAGNPAKYLTTRQEYDRKKEEWEAAVLGKTK